MTAPTTFSWNKEDWAGLSEMADGFDEYRPPLSSALDGQVSELHCRVVGSARIIHAGARVRDGDPAMDAARQQWHP